MVRRVLVALVLAVAVVAPAGPAPPARLAAGVEVLRGWGLEVRVPEPVAEGRTGELPWLAGSDEERAGRFTAAWTDPERIVGNLHRAYADLTVPVAERGGPIDFPGALGDMVTYNGGRRLTCIA